MVRHRGKPVVDQPELRIKVRIGNGAIGLGKIRLLEQIASTGSISSAARSCGMDYRRAQYLLDTIVKAVGTAMVKTVIGGAQGGGSELTQEGRDLVDAFRSLEDAVNLTALPHMDVINRILVRSE